MKFRMILVAALIALPLAGALPDPAGRLPNPEDAACDTGVVCPSSCNSVAVDDPTGSGIVPSTRLDTCCHLSISSQPDGSTRWTDPYGPGGTGFNRNSVGPISGGGIGGATKIWKENPGQGGSSDPLSPGVEFYTAFVVCKNIPMTGELYVLSDDANYVYVNNAFVGSCGVPTQPAGPCLTNVQHYTVSLLPYPQVNTLRFHVWNQPDQAGWTWSTNPAWLQYRLDF